MQCAEYTLLSLHVLDICVCVCVCLCVFLHVAHRLQILQVEVLVAEAVEAYNVGELQPQVRQRFSSTQHPLTTPTVDIAYDCK